MKLLLKRIARKRGYTIGKLYVGGQYFCDTLEDTDRGLKKTDGAAKIKQQKVFGDTAIPSGTYNVSLSVRSPRFGARAQYAFCGGRLPRLTDVPGFDGVLIHIGNTPKDTEGCILVGQNKAVGQVVNSTATFRKLYEALSQSRDAITLTIV